MNPFDTIIQEVTDMHPYKVRGDHSTYNQYNEGWADACDVMSSRLLEHMESELRSLKHRVYLLENIQADNDRLLAELNALRSGLCRDPLHSPPRYSIYSFALTEYYCPSRKHKTEILSK